MKKVFTLLTLLVAMLTGAWATTETTTATLNDWTDNKGTGAALTWESDNTVAVINCGTVDGGGVSLTSDESFKNISKIDLTVYVSGRDKTALKVEVGTITEGVFTPTTTVSSSYADSKLTLGGITISKNSTNYSGSVTISPATSGYVRISMTNSGGTGKTGKISNVKITSEPKTITSATLTGIKINGTTWDMAGLSSYAATIADEYAGPPTVDYIYDATYDDATSSTGKKHSILAVKDGANYKAVSTIFENNVTLTFTNVSNTLFSMTNPTAPVGDVASKTSSAVTATFSPGGSATIYNGRSSATTMVDGNGINLGGSGDSYFKADFTSPLAEGDVITSSNTSGTFYIWHSNAKSNSQTMPYTIPAESELIGKKTIYVKKNGTSTFNSFTITRITGTHTPTITQSGTSVTLECATDGATIYYTTDGSEPTTLSSTYSTAITLANSCTVRAFAKADGKDASEFAKKDCYVSHATADGYVASLGYNGGTVSGDVWTGTNFTVTNNVEGRGMGYVNLAGSQDGFKLNHTDSYNIQPSEGVKVTKIVVVGKSWLQGSAGNAATIAFDGFTPASGTFYDYLTDGETYVKTVEFTPSTEQTYGQAITMRPGTNQLGAFIEVYGDIKTYTVTYDGNGETGGTAPTDATAHKHNTSVTVLGNTGSLEKTGSTFVGWNTEADGSGIAYAVGSTFVITGNTTLYAQWAEGSSETITYVVKTTADASTTSSTHLTNLVNEKNVGIADVTDQTKSDRSGKYATSSTEGYGVQFTFDIADGYTFHPTSISMQLATVSTKDFTFYVKLTDSEGTTLTSNALNSFSGDGVLTNVTFPAYDKTFNAGTVTMLVTAVRKDDAAGFYRIGKTITISGAVKDGYAVRTKAGRNYATCVTPAAKKLDFANTDGITAYIATGLNGAEDAVVLKEVDVVPAGTPIIVKTDTKGATVNVPVTTADASSTSGNKLVAGDGVKTYNNEGNSYYYLASDQFHLANAGILQSGKAYLEVAGATAPQLSIIFGDSQTTGINAVNGEGLKVQGAEVYNLNGQRVLNPTKGLYIVNGKKVIVK